MPTFVGPPWKRFDFLFVIAFFSEGTSSNSCRAVGVVEGSGTSLNLTTTPTARCWLRPIETSLFSTLFEMCENLPLFKQQTYFSMLFSGLCVCTFFFLLNNKSSISVMATFQQCKSTQTVIVTV